jgi:hypothetical protein
MQVLIYSLLLAAWSLLFNGKKASTQWGCRTRNGVFYLMEKRHLHSGGAGQEKAMGTVPVHRQTSRMPLDDEPSPCSQ